jgi:hypothetical protein
VVLVSERELRQFIYQVFYCVGALLSKRSDEVAFAHWRARIDHAVTGLGHVEALATRVRVAKSGA